MRFTGFKFSARRCLLTLAGIACTQLAAPAFADTAPAAKISPITGVAADPNWAEEYAYALGVQAYTYAFPWFYNTLLRWKWTTQPAPNDRTPSMALNSFFHFRNLTDANYKDGGAPNNDTLYSVSWVDLDKEPMILSIPDLGRRYFSVQLAGFDSDNFAYISGRTTGTEAASYALVGPNWKGKLPAGVKALPPAHTSTIFVLARTLIDGPADLAAVHRLQDQYALTPLSRWVKRGELNVNTAENRNAWAPYSAKNDPLADWKTINRALTEIPPPARDAELLRQFTKIGIGPGLDIEKVDAATRRGLLRALDAGKRIVTGAASNGASGTRRNGWLIFPANYGHLGDDRDLLGRAGVQSLAAIVVNNPEEAMYPSLTHDGSGERLNGSHRYLLHFGKDELPPVNSFWSLTAYGMDFNMIENPLNRYSLGDRTQGMKRDADGGLTLYVQKDAPGGDKNSNWLPVAAGEYFLVMRLYLPQQKALDGKWVPPAMQRLD